MGRSLRILLLFACMLAVLTAVAAAQEPAAEEAPVTADLREARKLVKDGKYAEAEALLAGLQQEFPEDVSLLLMRGEQLLQLQRYEEARDVLQTAAELDGSRERIQFQLASALVRLGDADGALERFGNELNNTEDAQIVRLARLNRSMLFERARNWTGAAEEIEALLASETEEREVYGDLATLYLRGKQLDKAADALTRGEAAGFQSSLHYYSLGAHLYRDDQYETSVEFFNKALAIDGKMARAERSLAAALNKLERPQEALVHLRRYLEIDPDADDAESVREQIRRLESGSDGGS